jgi:AraC-like DNA-binding protein
MRIRQLFIIVTWIFAMSASALTPQNSNIEHYRAKVRDFQLLITSYSYNPDSVNNEAVKLIAQLKKKKMYILYFGVWDMYIQSLYYTGHQLKAQDELHKMFDEIKMMDNPEAEVHVYIAQGMLQQRFGNYMEAEKTLKKGLLICPPPSKCRYPRNSLSLYRWLIQTYIQSKRNYAEALKLCDMQEAVYREIVKRRLGDEYNRDKVMIMSQRASVLLCLKHIPEARRLIDSCTKMMRHDISPVLYMPYYEALMTYYEATADYDKALLLCDKMIDRFRNNYKPLQRQYMLAKAELLMNAGRKEEAAQAYQDFEKFDADFERMRITNDIQEMDVQYHVHKLEMQNERWHYYMVFLIAGIVVLIIAICVTVLSYLRTKRKNKIIVERLDDMRLFIHNKYNDESEGHHSDGNDIVSRFKDYVEMDEHLRNCDLKVSQIASDLGVNINVMTKNLRSATGLLPTEYIVKIRLEVARNRLIAQMNEPVQTVAYSCGYNTLRTFQRQFNNAYGMSPSAYRTVLMEKNKDKHGIS